MSDTLVVSPRAPVQPEPPAVERPDGGGRRARRAGSTPRVGGALAALGLYGAGVAVLGRDLWPRLNTSIIGPGDLDNFYYAWSVWEFKRALLAGQVPGYTHDVYGQAASIPIFSEGFLDHVLALPLQWVLSPLGAYNVTVLLSFLLGAFAMYLLASEFTPSWSARFAAGLVFSFSTPHLARAVGHLGLVTIEVLPFCAWCLVVFWRRPSARTAVLAGAGAGLVPWAAVYYAAYFLLPLVLIFGVAAALTDRRRLAGRRGLALVGLAAATGLLVAAPSLVDYPMLKPDVLGAIHAEASRWELRIFSANAAAFFLPDPYNPLLGSRVASLYPPTPGIPERSVFLGFPGLLLAAVALVLGRRDRAALVWLAVVVGGLALALGPGLRLGPRYVVPLPFYDLLYRWPPLDDFRAPNRLAVLAITGLAVLAALGIAAVQARLPRTRAWQAGGSVAMLCLVTAGLAPNFLFDYGLTSLPVRVPGLYTALAAAPDDGLVLETPPDAGSAQYFQTIHRKRLAAGLVPRLPESAALQLENVPYYSLIESGWRLPDSDTAAPAAGPDIYPLPRFADGLREHGISYVVLHRLSCIDPAALWPCYDLPNYEQARRFLLNTLGSPLYDDPREGLTGWHVRAGPPAADPEVRYELGPGWLPHLDQLADGTPRRVMGATAQVLIQPRTAVDQGLRLRASSYVEPMTLAVSLNGRSLGRFPLPVGGPQDLDLGPVQLRPGVNTLELRSLQGCLVRNDLDPRNYGPSSDLFDYRCASFAIDRIAVGP